MVHTPLPLWTVLHQTPGRMRIKFSVPLTASVQAYIQDQVQVIDPAIGFQWYPLTQTLVVHYRPESHEDLVKALESLDLDPLREAYLQPVDPEPETAYETIRQAFVHRWMYKVLLPQPIRHLWTFWKGIQYIREAFHHLIARKLTVEVLDAAAMGVSILRGEMAAASSIDFLLTLSSRLEANTLQSSYHNLKESLALSIDRVWKLQEGQPVEVKAASIQEGDQILVSKGSLIPFDGVICHGEGAVNEASITGESFPLHKHQADSVFANTVLEEGELTLKVTQLQSETAIAKLVNLIMESEKLQAPQQKKLERTANNLVKYNFLGIALTYLLTRNINRALTFLLVDFSCALRLIGPLTYLTAMKNASDQRIVIKGAKHIEQFASCDTYIFDKTGTLTRSLPVVRKVIPLAGYEYEEVIRIAACLEEHFYHPIADAIVHLAEEEDIHHEEMHTSINYIVAHGIESSIDGRRVTIGSKHFILEDEDTPVKPEVEEIIQSHEHLYNLLYLAYDGQLIAIFCIDAQIRSDARACLQALKTHGKRLILLTGDQELRAQAFVEELGVSFDQVYAEVSPEKKYALVQDQQAAGHQVVMVGDGINDSAALSLADIGIVLKDNSDLARQVSDVILVSDRLMDLLWLNDLSLALAKKLKQSTAFILAFNGALILFGVKQWLKGPQIAFLHNFSTFAMSFYSLKKLLNESDSPKSIEAWSIFSLETLKDPRSYRLSPWSKQEEGGFILSEFKFAS